ncbi:hypothetical protein OUZ56_029270 [Daphnia magna]|uniref:Uncharacterized protein n=1 Tax=Daphnia magna TaxID=35525 RepID=A0ABR0B6C5_9CRUS|nr:hypothetical protein OUZ56_029270 [Daphnia magna]
MSMQRLLLKNECDEVSRKKEETSNRTSLQEELKFKMDVAAHKIAFKGPSCCVNLLSPSVVAGAVRDGPCWREYIEMSRPHDGGG